MDIEQFVMAYGVEQDRLRAILPEGFRSLRPVLRINAEIRDGRTGYAEFNTAVERNGFRGWLNIGAWEDVPFERTEDTVVFSSALLEISFTGTGINGSCPAERDNDGCIFTGENAGLRAPELIDASKEFCDCSFRWKLPAGGASGVSIGKTLPAVPTEPKTVYPRADLTAENAAAIPCEQVLGAYRVRFIRR